MRITRLVAVHCTRPVMRVHAGHGHHPTARAFARDADWPQGSVTTGATGTVVRSCVSGLIRTGDGDGDKHQVVFYSMYGHL